MPQSEILLIILLSLMFIIALSFMDIFRRRRLFVFHRAIVKSELTCSECNLKILRDFKQGDYVFKVTEERCKRCGGTLIISGIYDVAPSPQRR